MKLLRAVLTGLATLCICHVQGQILMSEGGSYGQNFDTLGGTGFVTWSNNVTIPGWYASKTTSPYVPATYLVGGGGDNLSALYSFGLTPERALGSVAANSEGSFAYGARFYNDTAFARTNFSVGYTGEQWRNGGNTVAHSLVFSYRVDNSAITNADALNTQTWTTVSALNFTGPITGSTAFALNGNLAANRVVITNKPLPGLVVLPGQEVFFRWYDVNDANSDHGLAIDDVTISFQSINGPAVSVPLSISTNGTDIQISWSTNAIEAKLQSSPTLNPPLWHTVESTPVLNGATYVVMTNTLQTNQFYRLKD